MAVRTFDTDGGGRWRRIYIRNLEVQIVAAYRLLRRNDIEPILIKGWAAARNYPPAEPRFFTDIDLAVARDKFENAKALLRSEAGKGLDVDLHNEFRLLDTKPWIAVFDDSQTIDLDGCPIRVPSHEDHLRIMAVHWLNDGGESKDRLRDIYYAVANRPASFDWDSCLGSVSKNRRDWVVASIGLTHKYLGLPIDDLPFAEEAKLLPRWLTRTIEREWRAGVLHRSLHTCLNDPAEFLRQLRKRIPPNPIQATVECDGDIRSGSRLPYQIKSMSKRAVPSIRGIAQTIKLRAG